MLRDSVGMERSLEAQLRPREKNLRVKNKRVKEHVAPPYGWRRIFLKREGRLMRCEGCVRRKNQWRCLHNAGLIYRRCCRFMRIIYLEIKMHIRTARILFTAMISIFVRVIAGGLIEKVNV